MGSVRPQIAAAGVRGELECAARAAWAKRGWHGQLLAGRFLGVWTQMFFSERPWDSAVGGKWSKARWIRGLGVENLAGFRVRLSLCLPAMRKVLSTLSLRN